MQKITLRQEEYLLFFAERSGRNASIAAASELFGVAKPTVTRFTNVLEESGLIRKESGGEIELTDAGWEYIRPLLRKQQEIAEWMVSGLGLLPNAADQEARKLVTTLEAETVHALIEQWQEQKRSNSLVRSEKIFLDLKQGTYQIGFNLLKHGQPFKSMGDRGFQKPACLMIGEDGCEFRLCPKQIEYKPFRHCRLCYGTVDRLWYKLDGVWKESKVQMDGSYLIPSAAVLKVDQEEKNCLVPIRIRANVNNGFMPESEADLVFDMASILAKDIEY